MEERSASKDVLLKGNLFQVKHYFGVDVAELLSGTGNPTLPRLLVFLCEYILNNSPRVSSGNVILGWMNGIVGLCFCFFVCVFVFVFLFCFLNKQK